jgi:hypothetical protein
VDHSQIFDPDAPRILDKSALELGTAEIGDTLALGDELLRVDLEQPQALRRAVQVLVGGQADLAGGVSLGPTVEYQVERGLDLLAVARGVYGFVGDGRISLRCTGRDKRRCGQDGPPSWGRHPNGKIYYKKMWTSLSC